MRRSLLILLLFAPFLSSPDGVRAVQQTVDSRAPFAIELPEINTGLLNATTTTDIHIPPNSTITRLRLWVLNPYAARVGYRINASLSGQSRQGKSLGIVGQKGSGKHGNYFEVDLRQNPDIRLQSGKNVIEVTAEERDANTTYRCSFVLLRGLVATTKPACDPGESEIRTEHRLAPIDPGRPVSDRTAPQIILTEPKSALTAADASFTVRVAGEAKDDSGIIAVLTANGQHISPVPQTDNLTQKEKKKKDDRTPAPTDKPLKFDQTVTIPTNTRALLIEAQDRAGNSTLITIPVINLNCSRTVAATDFGGRKFALLVGVSKYLHHERGLNNLQFADRDATAIREWLRTSGGGNFREEDIECLTNDGATLAAVESAVNRFLTKASENDLIYLFLAGHGAPDPYNKQQLYFLLHDSKVADLPNTAFPMSKLGEFLEKQSKQVRLIAFFDTCHSAGIKGQRASINSPGKSTGNDSRGVGVKKTDATGSNATPNAPITTIATKPSTSSDFNFYNSELFKQKGWTIVTSSGMSELSQESIEWGGGHGVFTWTLLEGAKGKADANGDCRISAAELAQYVTVTVSRETGKEQNPQSLPGSSHDFVVATVQNATACRDAKLK